MKETITNTDVLYDGKIVRLEILEVELPDGEHAKREVVRHPGAVAMVALDDDQNVLLVRQYRVAAGRMTLEIPAGTLEPDELPADCATRELQEEARYRPNKLTSLGGIYTAPGYTSEFIHLFLATELTESILDMDADEFIEVERVPLKEALSRIENGELQDSKTVTGLLRVARHLGL